MALLELQAPFRHARMKSYTRELRAEGCGVPGCTYGCARYIGPLADSRRTPMPAPGSDRGIRRQARPEWKRCCWSLLDTERPL